MISKISSESFICIWFRPVLMMFFLGAVFGQSLNAYIAATQLPPLPSGVWCPPLPPPPLAGAGRAWGMDVAQAAHTDGGRDHPTVLRLRVRQAHLDNSIPFFLGHFHVFLSSTSAVGHTLPRAYVYWMLIGTLAIRCCGRFPPRCVQHPRVD